MNNKRSLLIVFLLVVVIFTLNLSVLADNHIEVAEVKYKSIEVSSILEGYPKKNAFDGDPETFWHSKVEGGGYQPVDINEGITVSFDGSYKLNKLSYHPRQDNQWSRITEYEIFVKEKGSENFESVYVGFVEIADDETQIVDLSKIIDKEVLALEFRGTLGSNGSMSVAELEITGEKIDD